MTAAGNPRFDADRDDTGHADEFWADALATHAAGSNAMGACAGSEPGKRESVTGKRPGMFARMGGVFGRFKRRTSNIERPTSNDE
jgi:hypothetical protein